MVRRSGRRSTALLRAGGVDGNSETRRGTISLFKGPEPVVKILDDPEREAMAVTKLLVAKGARRSSAPRIRGLCPIVCAVGSRPRRCAATGMRFRLLDENVETVTGQISIGTMYLAQGLEFRGVVVMACDDEVIPFQARIEAVTNDSDLEEV